ncbi:MAG: hypothetical protein LKF96_03240 [Treponema sp.]|jgi:hypothetical protein|nr:hypothetical protein [Treponema sp.]
MDDSTTRNEEIKEALDSLASIKASIRGNMQLIRPVIHNRAFVRFLGFCFSGTSVLFLLYLIRNLVWARRTAPFWFKPVVIIFLILFLTAAILWKISVLDRELRSTTKTIGLWGLFRIPEFVSLLLNIWLTSFLTLGIGSLIVYRTGNWWYLLPLAFVAYSYDLIQLSCALYLNEYRIAAFLGFVCALLQVIFMKGNYDLWLTGSIAGMIGIIYGTLKLYGKISAE